MRPFNIRVPVPARSGAGAGAGRDLGLEELDKGEGRERNDRFPLYD